MTALSVKLSRALSRGRNMPAPPQSRAGLLAILLRKRATAHNIGADDLEALLRDQIRWALPMQTDIEHAPPARELTE
ncbi:MAG: hypothetical protein JWL96_2528 [Sphingomonas bacterium]|uniref:hypothetical protein n=1 Tax=Sphingomonas bacterium TaxID=1895847 RepID=UPI0026018852|nr:hypothetical protein [Sphingomonas bacterium]MDB5710458.1 hypothetical protein [Sphingomonas bacterium]